MSSYAALPFSTNQTYVEQSILEFIINTQSPLYVIPMNYNHGREFLRRTGLATSPRIVIVTKEEDLIGAQGAVVLLEGWDRNPLAQRLDRILIMSKHRLEVLGVLEI